MYHVDSLPVTCDKLPCTPVHDQTCIFLKVARIYGRNMQEFRIMNMKRCATGWQ